MPQPMRQINLKEYQWSGPHRLSAVERDALCQAVPLKNIKPVPGKNNQYWLQPCSTIGNVEIGNLSVVIEPKISIPQVLSLACYAIGEVKFQPEDFNYLEKYALSDVLAIALTAQARRAFARGQLQGYRTDEAALYSVRGRIRFEEQLRRRFGVLLPVEVRYDEFTNDVLPNRLVKAAAYRLRATRLRSMSARSNLAWLAAMLENVSLEEFPPSDVPEVPYDRLNEYYRGVVTLARLILRHGAFQSGRGQIPASGFLMDMNKVFQEFVTVALRDALKLSPSEFCEKYIESLDCERRINLKPDLTWWHGGACVFVGDAKYKKTIPARMPNAENAREPNHVPNDDLYQLLAYVTALDLPGGLLIYAQGEADPWEYHVRYSGKRLEVAALDLSGTLDNALIRINELAGKVCALRREAQAN